MVLWTEKPVTEWDESVTIQCIAPKDCTCPPSADSPQTWCPNEPQCFITSTLYRMFCTYSQLIYFAWINIYYYYYKHQLYKVKGSEMLYPHRKINDKHSWISQMPVCDSEMQDNAREAWQRRFGSGIRGHVSVWWFSSLWWSVSWNDYAEGLGVNTMTHLLRSLLPPPIFIRTPAMWDLAPWLKPQFTWAW